MKSQSLIPADVWDSTPSTTNANEAQHHWTNSLTGIKLTLVEAIERYVTFFESCLQRSLIYSCYVVDQNTADEIQTSMRSGILTNPHNEVAHRMSRNSQRQSKTARKARESREQTAERTQLEVQLAEEAKARRQSSARTKELSAQLKVVKASSKKAKSSGASAILSASSSGRVKTLMREFFLNSSDPLMTIFQRTQLLRSQAERPPRLLTPRSMHLRSKTFSRPYPVLLNTVSSC